MFGKEDVRQWHVEMFPLLDKGNVIALGYLIYYFLSTVPLTIEQLNTASKFYSNTRFQSKFLIQFG